MLLGPVHHGTAAPGGHGFESATSTLPAGLIDEGGCRSVDDCPVCEYLALGQLPTAIERFTPGERVEHAPPPFQHLPHRHVSLRSPSRPRAPPADA